MDGVGIREEQKVAASLLRQLMARPILAHPAAGQRFALHNFTSLFSGVRSEQFARNAARRIGRMVVEHE